MNFTEQIDSDCLPIDVVLLDYYAFHDWTQYRSVQIGATTVYATIFLFGMLGNLSIIISIAKRKRIRLVANMFLVNLSITQIVMCMTALPITPISIIRKEWTFGKLMCKIFPMLNTVTVLLVSLSLCCIALDKYRNIVHPTKGRWTETSALVAIVSCLVLSMVMTIPYVITQELQFMTDPFLNISYCGEYCGEFGWLYKHPEMKKIYGFSLLFVQYGLPVILMSFCYWKILLKVKSDLVIGAHAGLSLQAQAARRKRGVMRALVLMVVAFVSSWLPLALLNILRDFDVSIGALEDQFYFVQLVAHSLAMASVIWNPILYFWMSKGHRTALKRGLTQVKSRATRASFFIQRHSNSYLDTMPDIMNRDPLIAPTKRGRRPRDAQSQLEREPGTLLLGMTHILQTKRSAPITSAQNISVSNGTLHRNSGASSSSLEVPKSRLLTKRYSFDPFVDFSDEECAGKEKTELGRKMKGGGGSKKLRGLTYHSIHWGSKKKQGRLSKRLPDIVTCAEEEIQG